MEASVGRVVHYVSYGSPVVDGKQAFKSECRAAIVTKVNSDGTVGLVVLNPTGLFFHEVCLHDALAAGGTWHWPERV